MKEDNKGTGFLVKGITDEHKDYLYQYAQKQLGSRSRTKAIIDILDKSMGKKNHVKAIEMPEKKLSSSRERLQISLLSEDYEALENVVKNTDSSPQYYIISLILKDLYGHQRLNGVQIELLRKSNYQLHKIGVNINQIAKAFNEGDKRKLNLDTLYKFIQSHVETVKELLAESQKKR